jgi:ribosomal subunit interface protein
MDTTVELVVTGRNIAESDRYRSAVSAKLAELDRLNPDVVRYDVELSHELNPRQSKSGQRVVITSHGKGVTVRSEARGADLPAALDDAVGKLEGQLRRSHDRRVRRRLRNRRTTTEPGRA